MAMFLNFNCSIMAPILQTNAGFTLNHTHWSWIFNKNKVLCWRNLNFDYDKNLEGEKIVRSRSRKKIQFCCDYEYICFTNPLLIQIRHGLVKINQDKVHGKKWQIGGCVKHAHVNSNHYQLKCT
jgi:hypothetical protein